MTLKLINTYIKKNKQIISFYSKHDHKLGDNFIADSFI